MDYSEDENDVVRPLLPATFHDVLQLSNNPFLKKGPIYLKPFYKVLGLVAVFYGLPSLQFVLIYSRQWGPQAGNNVSEEPIDTRSFCYYNFDCMTPLFGLAAGNNVLSNAGYVLAGLAFLLFVRLQQQQQDDHRPPPPSPGGSSYASSAMSSAPSSRPATATATSTNARPQQRQLQQPQPSHQRVLSRSSADDDNGDDGEQEEAADEQQPRRLLQPDEEAWQCGLHKDYSLYYALGWALVFEGVFSAMYHVCPSKISFQFDMTFMIIGTGLLFITLYQKRQPVFVPGVYRVFGLFALLVLLNVASLAIDMLPNLVFWVAVLGVMSYVSLLGSYYVYYGARISFFKRSQWQHLWRCVRRPVWPDQQFKFAALLFANALNYAITIYSIVRAYNSASARDFPSVILGIMNADLLIYFSFYVIMKARSGERLCLRPALLMFFTVVLWAGAIVFYEIPLTNKFLTPAESRALNRPCTFLIFDDHDAWHFTSAAAVCTSFFAMFFLDMDIVDKPRTAIAVF